MGATPDRDQRGKPTGFRIYGREENRWGKEGRDQKGINALVSRDQLPYQKGGGKAYHKGIRSERMKKKNKCADWQGVAEEVKVSFKKTWRCRWT